MSSQQIPALDRSGLRKFGLVTSLAFVVIFVVLLPWLFSFDRPLWPWLVAAVLSTWALLAPHTLNPVYQAWMRLALLISRVTTPLVLGIVFFLVFLPVGILMKLVGHDPMRRKLDALATSYRTQSTLEEPKEQMENPY